METENGSMRITGHGSGVASPSRRNEELLRERAAAYEGRGGPAVGQYVRVGGALLRFTHDWGEGIQTTIEGGAGYESFYLSAGGHAEYSGGLDRPIPKERLRETGERRPAAFWFFDGDWPRAHSAVTVELPVAVYEVEEESGEK